MSSPSHVYQRSRRELTSRCRYPFALRIFIPLMLLSLVMVWFRPCYATVTIPSDSMFLVPSSSSSTTSLVSYKSRQPFWTKRVNNHNHHDPQQYPRWIDAISRGGADYSSDHSSNDNGSTETTAPVTGINAIDTTIESPPSKDVEIANQVEPPPPPPVATTVTSTTATTTDSLNTTHKNVTALIHTVIHRTATGSVAAAVVIQKQLRNSHQKLLDTVQTTGANLQPYVPINEKYTLTSPTVMILASLFAMNSGYLNGLGLYGIARAVSSSSTPTLAVAAVTSAYTNMALQIARGDWKFITMIPFRLIVSYLMGSFVTGYLVASPPSSPYEIQTYPASAVLAMGTMALFLVSSMLSSSGHDVSLSIFYLLTFVNGLQNALTSIYSNNQIRSAHYSGMTSDTGTFLGQYLHRRITSGEPKNDLLPKVYRNSILSASFVIGGILSYWVSQYSASGQVVLPSLLLYLTVTIASLLWKPQTTDISPPLTLPARP